MIYEVQITKENIKELLYKEMVRVATDYHRSPQELIAAFVLPPSAFKLMEEFARAEFRMLYEGRHKGTLEWNGICLFCGATPVILPVYSGEYWHCAHMDARKMVSEIGGLDS